MFFPQYYQMFLRARIRDFDIPHIIEQEGHLGQ